MSFCVALHTPPQGVVHAPPRHELHVYCWLLVVFVSVETWVTIDFFGEGAIRSATDFLGLARSRSLSAIFASAFFLYVFVNVSMVLGLLPIVGAPLPIMSYGGSSMLASASAAPSMPSGPLSPSLPPSAVYYPPAGKTARRRRSLGSFFGCSASRRVRGARPAERAVWHN